jgi:uncharacterized membrane protein YdbT with pleckstrin-like domain
VHEDFLPKNAKVDQVDADETKLAEIRRHPFGIIIVYIQAIIGMAVATALSFLLIPSFFDDGDQATTVATLILVIISIFIGLIILVATFVYRQSRIVVTDKNVTQVLQIGLFSRKVSQLDIRDVEDVTAIRDGFFQSVFNFGVLKIETAGEQMNFIFDYCPRPDYFAKLVLEARQLCIERNGTHKND